MMDHMRYTRRNLQQLLEDAREATMRHSEPSVAISSTSGDGYVYAAMSATDAIRHWKRHGCRFEHVSDVCSCQYAFLCRVCETQQVVSGEDMALVISFDGHCEMCA